MASEEEISYQIEIDQGAGVPGLTVVASLLARLNYWCVALGTAALLGSVTIQVVGRYFFSYTPAWSSVLAAYLLTWITLLGAAYATRAGINLSVDLVERLLPARHRALLQIVIDLSCLMFAGILLVAGIHQVSVTSALRSYGLGVSASWLYLSAPVAAALMIIFLIERLLGRLLTLRKLESPR